jgi:homoserine/homoserine lactone efflux protein
MAFYIYYNSKGFNLDLNSYLLFIIISFFYVISPGLAVFLVIQYSAIYDYKKIFLLILGNISGLAVLAFISAIGIGVIISNSVFYTNIIKYLGAVVLIYLAFKMIFISNKHKNTKEIIDNNKSFYKQGLLLAISNPKPIVFFTSIYPQFVTSPTNQYLWFFILAITFMFLSFSMLHVYAFLAKNTIGKLLNKENLNIFNKISGIALLITAILIIIV